MKFQVKQNSSPIITANNSAVALASDCNHCGANAVAFQVLLVSKENLASVSAYNSALADSSDCNCSTFAGAYLIIYATDSQSLLSRELKQTLAGAKAGLKALQYFGSYNGHTVQEQSDKLASRIVSMLQRSSDGTAPVSPAINGSQLPAQLVNNSAPVVDLFKNAQNPNG